jgi:hypothetical protein
LCKDKEIKSWGVGTSRPQDLSLKDGNLARVQALLGSCEFLFSLDTWDIYLQLVLEQKL